MENIQPRSTSRMVLALLCFGWILTVIFGLTSILLIVNNLRLESSLANLLDKLRFETDSHYSEIVKIDQELQQCLDTIRTDLTDTATEIKVTDKVDEQQVDESALLKPTNWVNKTHSLDGYSFSIPESWNIYRLDGSPIEGTLSNETFVLSPKQISPYYGGGVGPVYQNALIVMKRSGSSYAQKVSQLQSYADENMQRVKLQQCELFQRKCQKLTVDSANPDGEDILPGTYYYLGLDNDLLELYYLSSNLAPDYFTSINRIIESFSL